MADSPATEELERQAQERRLQALDRENYLVTIATGIIPHRSELLLAEPLASDTPLVDPDTYRSPLDDHAAHEASADDATADDAAADDATAGEAATLDAAAADLVASHDGADAGGDGGA